MVPLSGSHLKCRCTRAELVLHHAFVVACCIMFTLWCSMLMVGLGQGQQEAANNLLHRASVLLLPLVCCSSVSLCMCTVSMVMAVLMYHWRLTFTTWTATVIDSDIADAPCRRRAAYSTCLHTYVYLHRY